MNEKIMTIAFYRQWISFIRIDAAAPVYEGNICSFLQTDSILFTQIEVAIEVLGLGFERETTNS